MEDSVFWEKLKEAYIELTKPDIHLVRDIYVKIPELRRKMKVDAFDEQLRRLFKITEYGRLMEASACSIIYYENELKKNRANTRWKDEKGYGYYFLAILPEAFSANKHRKRST